MKIYAFCMVLLCAILCSCQPETTSENTVESTETTTVEIPAKPETSSSIKTMKAKFDGAEMGDYFHLSFTAEDGTSWDFGNGKNDLGQFEILGDTETPGMETYIGKIFEIQWDSLMSSYYCCEGGMDVVEGKQPSIVGLKLVE